MKRNRLPMWCRHSFLLSAVLSLTPAEAAIPHAHLPVHRAPSAEPFTVAATAGDLVARRSDGTIVFSAKTFADAQQAALQALLGSDLKTVRHRFSFISLAGPLLTIRDDIVLNEASPIPGGSARYWAIDLRQPATYHFTSAEPLQPAPNDRTLLDLRRYYSAGTLARAIGGTAPGARSTTSPAARDLRYVLSDLSKRGQSAGHCFGADYSTLSSFALTSVSTNKIRVQLGMSGQASCRHELTPLEISLPQTPTLQSIVGRSAVRREHFDTITVDTPTQ